MHERPAPLAPESGDHWILPPETSSVASARRLTRITLTEGGVQPSLIDDAMLVVSELVTNALTHAAPPATFALARTPGGVRGEVTDHGPLTMLAPAQAGGAAIRGRGLDLVDSLTHRWGVAVDPDRGRKTVWFELATAW